MKNCTHVANPHALSVLCIKGKKNNQRSQFRTQRRKISTLFMEGEEQSRRREVSTASRIKRECLSFTASLQESFRYIKASLVGQVKKITAKNEEEATEADLLASKMQVDAAEEAEETKKRLDKSR